MKSIIYIKNFTSYNDGILYSYIRISWFLLPLLSIQIIAGFLGLYDIPIFQFFLLISGIIGLTSFNLFKNNKWFKGNFYTIQSVFLIFLILLEFCWYIYEPSERQLVSFLLGSTITGVAIFKPKNTIVFFVFVLLFLIISNYLKQVDLLQHLNYFILAATCIVAFNYWRDKIARFLKLSESSYKNMFSDSTSLIFILEKNDFSIIENNNTAQNYLKEKQINSPNFLDVFCINLEEKNQLKQILNQSTFNSNNNTLELETQIDNIDYYPKELIFKHSSFFNEEVIIVTVNIIKERKEKEIFIEESKKNITQILDNINSFVYNISFHDNGDRRVRFVSKKAEEILKIDIDELIMRFKSNKNGEIVHPDDLEFVKFKVEECSKTLKPSILQYRIFIDGEYRWFEEKIVPKREKDCFVHFGIVTDITIQKTNELEIVNSEEKYRLLFEKNLAGIYKTNVDGQIIEANQSLADILGVESVEELKKHNIKDFYFNDFDRKEYLNDLSKTKILTNYILSLKRIDGKRIIINNNVFFITNYKKESYITGTLIDVTELHETTETLKKKENILLESQESFKNIINGAPYALLIFNNLNKLVFSNTIGEDFYNTHLNNASTEFDEIFDKKHKYIIENVLSENKKNVESYTEIVFETDTIDKTFVLQSVDVNYNNEKSKLLIFRDVSLEQEYNNQKLRAELAEVLNNKLEQEILRHRETQRLLLENKAFIENIFNSSLDMIISTDINNQITSVNKTALKRFGYKRDEMLYKDGAMIVASSFSLVTVIRAITKSGKFVGEVENVDSKGNIFKAFLSATSIKDENNKVIGYMGISRDLSEIEEIKKIISTQSSLIESLFQNESNILIWVINQDMNLVSYNESTNTYFSNIKGNDLIKGKEFLSQIKNVIKKKHIAVTENIYTRALKGEKIEFEALMYGADDKKHWVDVHLSPIILPDGTIEEVICLGHDITEKKEKTRQIQENESNIRAVVKALPDMIFKLTSDGFIVDYEANTEEQKFILKSFVKGATDLVGKNISKFYNTSSKFYKQILSIIKKVIESEEIITQNFTYKFQGKEIHFENRYSKISDNQVIVLVRNITEEVENKQKLIDSVEEKEVLLKEVHHRVKNNLQIINSILNLQSSYVSDEKTLEIINESQNRIRSMSYIHESLYQSSNFSSINFKDYIENLISNLMYSYQIGNNVKITKEITAIDLSLDQAIPCGLILNEIITNALKYAYGDTEKGTIVIDITENKNKVKIIVEDFGVGLPKNFNIETSDSLGLSLVHTLVDQIDGELTVKSDGGTKFLIIFEKLES